MLRFTKGYATCIFTRSVIINNFENRMKWMQKRNFINIHGPYCEEIVNDLNLANKTCLITGANSGIGFEMTRCLSSRECNVLMACRNTYAANVSKNLCENRNRLQIYELDLSSLKSVKQCAENIVNNHKKIDIVILNAGVFGLPWTLTENGLETTFQVNYLSHYFLLSNIEKILAEDARVVMISSESHRNVNWNLYNMLAPTERQLSLPKEEYTSIRAYNISKLCGVLWMQYLARARGGEARARAVCAHPGSFVRTRLCRNWWVYEALYTTLSPFTKSMSQAASTPLYCATSPEVQTLSAIYFKDCKPSDESEIAKDSHLSFRIIDLTNEIIRDRVAALDRVQSDFGDPSSQRAVKEAIDKSPISSYST